MFFFLADDRRQDNDISTNQNYFSEHVLWYHFSEHVLQFTICQEELEDTSAEVWTDDKEERLIEMRQERPCLHVTISPEYCDRIKRLAAVAAIVSELSPSGEI